MPPALPGCCWLSSMAAAWSGSAVEPRFALCLWPASRILPGPQSPSIALALVLCICWLLPAKFFWSIPRLDNLTWKYRQCSATRDYFFLQGMGKLEIIFTGGQFQVSPWHSPCYSRGLVQKNKLHHFTEDQKWLINPGKLIWCGEIGLRKSCWSICCSRSDC